jgi:DNA polymerase I
MDSTDKRLFLLDAFALIYRAYFAFSNNHRVNSKGLNTSAVFGFTNTLLEVLKKEKPTHIAVVFDTAAPTQRHVEFTEYKAQREEMPEDLAKSIPYVKRLIEGFRIPVLEVDGFEADDIIGTLAKKAEQQGYITYMMTPDKDYGQLVSDNIYIYKPARAGNGAEILGPKQVCEKWQIKDVNQLIDILGLMGDSVDNIPGIPGVGEKTAIQLIKDFGSIENLLENTDKLKGKLKEKVENNKEKATQSKWLATIITDVPIEFEEEKLIMEEPDKEALKELFTELEFRRLAEQVLGTSLLIPSKEEGPKTATNGQIDLFGHSAPEKEQITPTGEETIAFTEPLKTIQSVSHHYYIVDTKEKRSERLSQLLQQKEVCFDTETTGLDAHTAELVGMSFAWKDNEAYYVPFPENQT